MTDDITQAALTTWAAKDLPARLLAAQADIGWAGIIT